MKQSKIIRPDNKGRICLGKLAEGVSRFIVEVDKDHRIILDPLVEIPAREKWLYENKPALKSVKQGLKEAKAGKLHNLGDFTQYLEEDDD